MAEQDTKSSGEDGEHPAEDVPTTALDMGDDDGADGEIEDEEAVVVIEGKGEEDKGKNKLGDESPLGHNVLSKDAGDSRKHRNSSDRRRHHHHHHRSNSHRDHRRRRSGGHSETDGDTHGSDEENRGGSGRVGRRSDSTADSFSDHSSPRKHRDRRSSRSSSSRGQSHRARHSIGESESGELLESQEDPLLPHTHKKTMKEKRDSIPMEALPEKGEAEDGEILEDGELDEDEEGVIEKGEDPIKEERVTPPKKSPSKEDVKVEKQEKKKSDHKDRRKRESDEKRKRKKYSDGEEDIGVSTPSPAWGSGYQAPKRKSSPTASRAKQPRYSRGSKGYHSPPGLYDSPSYSDNSDEESVPTGLLTEGYIDASVAADEKEGIFNRNLNLKKKKKRDRNYDRSDRKRSRNQDSKFDGGPMKKKPLVDLAMSERPVCKFYMEGKCAKGSGCPFNHDVESPRKKNEVCKYHLTVKGCHKERCLYMHEDFPCKYYHTGAKCYSGDRCKFSHDPLTEDTRRALEMRVAAEDIVDMENPDYDYDYRSREFDRMRPSLLGSPPRLRPDMKKIPSLFEIEVHPPGQSPKPSPQTVRPSGFYNETTISPKPGMGQNSAVGNGLLSSPNMGVMNNAGGSMNQGNQQGQQNNQSNMGGAGMMAGMRPGNMMGGPNNRPGLMMGNAQGLVPQQQRPGGAAPIQFMGPGQMNNNQQSQGGNLPPILNMIGSIIREAAMQTGPGAAANMGQTNMGPTNMGQNSMGQRANNMGSNMNNMGPNSMRQGNMNMPQNTMGNIPQNNMGNNMTQGNMAQGNMGQGNMAQNNMGNMAQNNMGNMAQTNMGNMAQNNMGNMPQNNMTPNNMGMVQNMMGPPVNSIGQGSNMAPPNKAMGMGNNIGPNTAMSNTGGPNNMPPNNNMTNNMNPNNSDMNGVMSSSNAGLGQPNMGQEVGIMDVDYRIKRDFEEMEEASQDLTELDKIRRQIQEQIEKEEEGEAEEEVSETHEEGEEDAKMNVENQLSPQRKEDSQGKEDDKAGLKAEVDKELEQIQIPSHLPKKQRELFIRIQQQQLLREKEKERQEAAKAAEEAEAKAEVDDWYSSDEDGEEESKPKLTDVLKKLSQDTASSSSTQSSVLPSVTVSSSSSSLAAAATSTASAFNIMQMINAIKSQTVSSTSTTATKPAESAEATLQSLTKLSTNSGPDPRQRKNSLSYSPASPPQSSSVTKPAGNSAGLHHPSMPSLHLPALTVDPPVVSARPMKPLPYGVVKISLLVPKPYTELPDNLNASDPAFKNDPRVKWHLQYIEKHPPKEVQRRLSEEGEKPQKPSDPRLKKGPSDPRLAKAGDSPGSGRGDGSRPVDPRLQRSQPPARPVDPRLARATAGNMDPRLNRQNSQNSQDNANFMGGPMNPNMNNMGGMMGNQMGGMMNNQMGLQMGGPMNNMGGGLMNNRAGLMNNPSGPMNNPVGGPMGQMNMGMNNMGGLGRQMQGGIPVNNMSNMNMMAGPMGKMGLMGPVPNQNRMAGSQGLGGNMLGSGNVMGNQMERTMANQGGGLMGQAPPGAMGMLSGPRLGGPMQPNDPRAVNDPRMKNRPADPREQRMNPKDPRAGGRDPRSGSGRLLNEETSLSEQRTFANNDPRSFQGSGDFRQSPNDYQQSPNDFSQGSDILSSGGDLAQPKISQGREGWRPNIDESLMDKDERNPSIPVSTSSVFMSSSQDFDNDDQKQTVPKFDYRNDPRFKRVKRSTGQRKGSMEYSSPLGGEGQGGSDDGGDSAYNSYNRPKISNESRRKNAPSPTLPDTLQDFDLPETPPLTVTEPEPELKVKDLFSTIDPTASPFC